MIPIAERMPLLAVVSCAMPADALENLRHMTAAVILLPPDPLLPAPVASHADMLLFSLGDALVTHRSYYETARTEMDSILRMAGLRLVLTDCPRGDTYPLDIGLNALLCGRYLFGRLDALAPEIPVLTEEHGITPVSIRQGYAGCSGLVINGAVITADPSLTGAANDRGIPVISVTDKEIRLPGYDHGFIGGCGGVWQNEIFLCGTMPAETFTDFAHHPGLRGVKIHMLSRNPLYDFGGIKLFPL
ncbi:MAG: hypothetical protein E7631_03790 [Ruminococcaceae bacterium]|nr:hypothetical protein [Oscillospiraceae bacterium]